MKSIGVVRKTDELGRIVIPMELRRTMDINEGTPLEIFTDGERIILQKYQRGCCFCGEFHDDMVAHGGKLICPACVKQLQKQVHLDRAVSKKGAVR